MSFPEYCVKLTLDAHVAELGVEPVELSIADIWPDFVRIVGMNVEPVQYLIRVTVARMDLRENVDHLDHLSLDQFVEALPCHVSFLHIDFDVVDVAIDVSDAYAVSFGSQGHCVLDQELDDETEAGLVRGDLMLGAILSSQIDRHHGHFLPAMK